jgi:hypothetical protein
MNLFLAVLSTPTKRMKGVSRVFTELCNYLWRGFRKMWHGGGSGKGWN